MKPETEKIRSSRKVQEERVCKETVSDLFYRGSVPSPFVSLKINNEMIPLMVDTGCDVTTIGYTQIELWNLEDEVREVAPNIYMITLLAEVSGHQFYADYYVESYLGSCNLLGLEILRGFCCTLDLKSNTLTFRSKVPVPPENLLNSTAIVDGKTFHVILDTGCNMFLVFPTGFEEKLTVPLTDGQNESYFCYENPPTITHIGYGAAVKALGKELIGDIHVTSEVSESNRAILGIDHLAGLVIEFYEDSTFEVWNPDTNECLETGRPAEAE